MGAGENDASRSARRRFVLIVMGIYRGLHTQIIAMQFRTNSYEKNRITDENSAILFGVYDALIVNSRTGPNNLYFTLELSFKNPVYQDRKIYSLLPQELPIASLNHISARILRQICEAISIDIPSCHKQLRNRPVRILVDNDGQFNRILEFKSAHTPKSSQ